MGLCPSPPSVRFSHGSITCAKELTAEISWTRRLAPGISNLPLLFLHMPDLGIDSEDIYLSVIADQIPCGVSDLSRILVAFLRKRFLSELCPEPVRSDVQPHLLRELNHVYMSERSIVPVCSYVRFWTS